MKLHLLNVKKLSGDVVNCDICHAVIMSGSRNFNEDREDAGGCRHVSGTKETTHAAKCCPAFPAAPRYQAQHLSWQQAERRPQAGSISHVSYSM